MSDRTDKIEALLGTPTTLDGAGSLLTFGLLNPWTLILDFGPSVTAQLAAQGGGTISIPIGSGDLGALIGNATGGVQIAFVWDDEVKELVETVVEGHLLVAKIGPPRGQVLSLWADQAVQVGAFTVDGPEAADAIAAKLNAAGANGAAAPSFLDSVSNAVQGVGNKFFDFQTTTVQTLIVVAGLVVFGWLIFEGPSFKNLGKNLGGGA